MALPTPATPHPQHLWGHADMAPALPSRPSCPREWVLGWGQLWTIPTVAGKPLFLAPPSPLLALGALLPLRHSHLMMGHSRPPSGGVLGRQWVLDILHGLARPPCPAGLHAGCTVALVPSCVTSPRGHALARGQVGRASLSCVEVWPSRQPGGAVSVTLFSRFVPAALAALAPPSFLTLAAAA